ncbi:MAG: hypothetical protein J5658_03960 [Prevotella sp.]|nr:hypothetical protein [Prevotella sp.]
MERSAIYNKYPEYLVKLAFEKYPVETEIVLCGYAACLDHTGECMDDYMIDINESPRIAFMEGFSEGMGRALETARNIHHESNR